MTRELTAALLGLTFAAGCTEPGDKGDGLGHSGAAPPTGTGPETGPNPGRDPAEGLCQVTVECYGSVLDDPKTPCALQIVDEDGVTVYEGDAGFELRGRSSLTYPKPQYAIELRGHSELPVWPGGDWRYFDEGDDLGTAWKEVGYDDRAWPEGPGAFGRGYDYLRTQVDATPGPTGRSVTTYFRRAFEVGDRPSVTDLEIGLRRDDAAVVWLNGVEVVRDNLPSVARFDTPALEPAPEDDVGRWHVVHVDPSLLRDGANTLAVEVHREDADSAKLRFDLYLEATGDEADVDLLRMGADDDWILNGQYVDRSLFRNRLAYDLFQSFGGNERYATETRFCEMVMNDAFVGVYTLGEKLDRGAARLDLNGGDDPGDSFLVKLDEEDGFHDNAVGYGEWQMVWPDDDPVAAEATAQVLERFEEAVLGPDPADPDDGIFSIVDLDSAVDWVLLQELVKNNDAYLLSVHLWRNEGGKLSFAPWDFDLTMGYPSGSCGADGWNPRRWYGAGPDPVEITFIQEMAAVPAFRERLVERWRELRQDQLSEETVLRRIAGYDATLGPAIEPNFEVWPIEDITFTWGDSDENRLCPVTSYEEEHERTVRFLTDRLAWMDANIESF